VLKSKYLRFLLTTEYAHFGKTIPKMGLGWVDQE